MRRVCHIASLLHRVLRAQAAPGVVPGAFWGLFRGAQRSRRGNRHNGHEGDWRDPPRGSEQGVSPSALCGRLPLEEARLAASRASFPQGTHWPRSRPAELRSTSQAPRHRSKSPPAARPPAPGCHTGREAARVMNSRESCARSRPRRCWQPLRTPDLFPGRTNRVGAKPAGDGVVSTTAVEGVVTGVAEYAIVPAAAVHGVVAGAARYPDVGAVATVDLVSSGTAPVAVATAVQAPRERSG
jgi:hypothetical protein